MPGIFDALPGLEVPVSSIASGLDQMWEGAASAGKPSPEGDSAKATQVNFVLHLGLHTDVDDALRQFGIAVNFSRKYPCRVVVLCPMREESGPGDMRAKVYGECTLGRSRDDTRCCEFVLLSYSRAARPFLENQVSICLSSDLPIYYWAHRFTDTSKLADYTYMLAHSRRVIVDSAVFPCASGECDWPKAEIVRDLAFARLLPVRQSIGQFLGRYPPRSLGQGLESVSLVHGSAHAAEGRSLMEWLRARLAACGALGQKEMLGADHSAEPRSFLLSLAYRDGRYFRWDADVDARHASFEADLGRGRTSMTGSVSLLSPEDALSEAMFF